MVGVTVDQHECTFPEVTIEADDEDVNGLLVAGMAVLTPCACGETPLEHVEWMDRHLAEMQAALLATQPFRPLYHWSPIARRKQILRYGLRPGMRVTTTTASLGGAAVCFADTPSWAWALSAGMPWTPDGEWDLWQTTLDRLTEPVVLATEDRPTGLYEVRTQHRVFKRDLWHVGTRTKTPGGRPRC